MVFFIVGTLIYVLLNNDFLLLEFSLIGMVSLLIIGIDLYSFETPNRSKINLNTSLILKSIYLLVISLILMIEWLEM